MDEKLRKMEKSKVNSKKWKKWLKMDENVWL
jgi:hypothetical protein